MNSIDVNNPFDQSLIKSLPISSSAQLESAISKAHSLVENRNNWLPAHQRVEIFERVISIMSEQIEDSLNWRQVKVESLILTQK